MKLRENESSTRKGELKEEGWVSRGGPRLPIKHSTSAHNPSFFFVVGETCSACEHTTLSMRTSTLRGLLNGEHSEHLIRNVRLEAPAK